MVSFKTIASLLAEAPELDAALGYEGIVTYINLVHILHFDLSSWQDTDEPPANLPVAVHDFLKVCLHLDDEMAKLAWVTLRHAAWDFSAHEDHLLGRGHNDIRYLRLFLKHGLCRGLGMSLV